MAKKAGKITVWILLSLTVLVISLQWWIVNRPREIVLFENGENLMYTYEKDSGYLMPKERMRPALQLVRQTEKTLIVRVGVLKKNSPVKILEVKNDWGKINYRGKIRWILITYTKKK